MRNCVVLLIALSGQLVAQKVRVPFVGCAVDGQNQIIEAPKGVDQALPIPAAAAQRLAYYKEGWRRTAVLAPRGWHCLGNYGSSGSLLSVMPGDAALGAIVQLDYISSDNGSGSYEMAQVLARTFPDQRAYIRQGADISEPPGNQVPFGAFPHDELIQRSGHTVHYRTPANSEGLGTMNGFKANGDQIDTVAVFQEGNRGLGAYLLMLRVRLPRELRDLTPVIIHDLLVRQSRDTR